MKLKKGTIFVIEYVEWQRARMRSWIATGNDPNHAIDIKEGIEYAGGIRSTKLAVAEIIPDTGIQSFHPKNFVFALHFQGYLDKTYVPNVPVLRSIRYGPNDMKVFKASGGGTGISIPYKQLGFETNMRTISPFRNPINDQGQTTIPKQ